MGQLHMMSDIYVAGGVSHVLMDIISTLSLENSGKSNPRDKLDMKRFRASLRHISTLNTASFN